MRMFGARVNFQAFQHIPAQLVLGQHSSDGQLDYFFRLTGSHIFERLFPQTAYVTGVPAVFLVAFLLTRYLHNLSVGDTIKAPESTAGV